MANGNVAIGDDERISTYNKASAQKMSLRYLMSHEGFRHPMRTYIWIILLTIGIMSALWFVMGIGPNAQGTIPPSFGLGAPDLYFHSIAIGIAALLACLVIVAYDLDKYEPHIDFPIAYRATLATVIGAVGAFFYLNPVFHPALAPIPLGLITIGLLLLADVGGALLVELYLLPGKLSGRYQPEKNILGMVPRWKYLPGWGDFKRMDSVYFLVLTTVAGTFIAGIIGFVALWLNYFTITIGVSPAIFSGYIAWMGGAAAFLGYTIGSHSHIIGMTLILGAVALVAKYFGVLSLSGLKRAVAKWGIWISIIGIMIMVTVFLLEAFTTIWPSSVPPLLFASNPGGFQLWSFTAQNGMAGDDTTMFIAAIGAIIMLAPLLLTRIKGRPAWKDPLKLSILATWVVAFIATPVEGFFIEFNEATLSGGPTDIIFGNLQYFALFSLLMLTLAFIAVDFFEHKESTRKIIAITGIAIAVFTLITGYIYAFFSPNVNPNGSLSGLTAWGWAFALGLLAISAIVIAAMVSVYRGRQTMPKYNSPEDIASKEIADTD